MLVQMVSWVTVTTVTAPLMLKGTLRFKTNVWRHPDNFFSVMFSDNAKKHSAQLGYKPDLPAVQTCLALKMCGAL